MSFLSMARILKIGLKNFWRNIWLSIATTGIMILTIFSVVLLVMLNIIADVALTSLEEKIDVSIYFSSDTAETKILEVKNTLDALPETRETRYITKEEALVQFRERHGDNQLIISSLEELDENPLQPTIVVKARNPEDFPQISEVLKDQKYAESIESFNYEDNQVVIEKLSNTTATLEKVGIGLSIGFAIISVLVMFNTIRITMYTQKEEISIMRLVGASNAFTTTPYIIEGILYGFLATIFSTVFLFMLLKYTAPFINGFLENQVDVFAYFSNNFLYIVGAELLFGIVLGVISSLIAIRRYLKI